MTSVLVFLFIALIYFLPSFVATSRHSERSGQIFLINLLLGWTLLGWIVALIWAVGKNEPRPQAKQLRKCPYCQEDVQAAAIVCKHCGKDIAPTAAPAA